MRKGYTLAELLVVIGIVMALALVSFVSFVNRRNKTSLTATAAQMAGLLREAQSRSVAQASSTSWGVHFDNGSNGGTPFFALFSLSYNTSTNAGYYPLPVWVSYASSSVAPGSYAEIVFSQLSGRASGSSSIVITLAQTPQTSSTISVTAAGSVSY